MDSWKLEYKTKPKIESLRPENGNQKGNENQIIKIQMLKARSRKTKSESQKTETDDQKKTKKNKTSVLKTDAKSQ